jgi:hypothetical protein
VVAPAVHGEVAEKDAGEVDLDGCANIAALTRGEREIRGLSKALFCPRASGHSRWPAMSYGMTSGLSVGRILSTPAHTNVAMSRVLSPQPDV